MSFLKHEKTTLKIKSSNRFISGQNLLILCGSICCCIVIPLLIAINSDKAVVNEMFNDILSNPLVAICFLVMILCPIIIVLLLICKTISNLLISTKPNFIKEIILDNKNNYIKVYSNVDEKIVPFNDINSFDVHITTTAVPNVRPGTVRAGLSIGNYLDNNALGAGLIGAASYNTGGSEVVTDIEIIISTENDGNFKINTLGNVLFDSNSQKLLSAIIEYETKIKGFNICKI